MNNEQELVRDFHLAAGLEVNEIPQLPTKETQLARIRMLKEELDELDAAFIENDLVEVADAIGDLLYIALGTAVSCGIDITPVYHEIHRSNMTKFIDGHLENGKWVKGPSYDPANLKPILWDQMHP